MQELHLGEILAAKLRGQPITQLSLDLRHICPLSGAPLIATQYTGRALYIYENRSKEDQNSTEWRRYIVNIRSHNRRTAGY